MTSTTEIDAPAIAITVGDPSGIGPEIVAAAIMAADEPLRRRLRVYGDAATLEGNFDGASPPRQFTLVDRGVLGPGEVTPGRPNLASAEAQVAYLEAAIEAALAGEVGAIVTAPIHKASARRAGMEGIGHTELLARRFGAESVAMMFAGPRIKVVLATIHVPLSEVPRALTTDAVIEACTLGIASVRRDFGIDRPTVGVLGLNPHAGEDGMLGYEEFAVIEPAIEECRARLGDDAEIVGPLVPDVAFRNDYDLFVAMYHDQALIPVKLLDFDATVNVTLGLPIVRTSPDHGVAHDIAGTGTARPESFIAALALADRMLKARTR